MTVVRLNNQYQVPQPGATLLGRFGAQSDQTVLDDTADRISERSLFSNPDDQSGRRR